MVRNEYHSECFCRANHYHAQCSLVLFAMQTPSMSSWVFTCPHRQQPFQSHATSCGKSMTLHIAFHFQGRQCPCASSLACSGQGRQCPCASSLACSGQGQLCSCADSLVDLPGRFVRRTRGLETMSYFLTINGKWRRIVAVCSEAGAHPGKAFIQRHSRIHDFVLKHGFLHMICVWSFGMLVAGIASIFLSSFGLDDYWHKDCGK